MQIIQTSERQDSVSFNVISPKTYSTHERACRYGQVRGAAPIKMLDGSDRWVALPFYLARGRVALYNEAA